MDDEKNMTSASGEMYCIRSVADLCNIPPDRLSDCMRGIEEAVRMHCFVTGAVALDSIVWVDDGDHSVSMMDVSNGEVYAELKIEKAD